GDLEVTYDKFGRYTAPMTYEIKLTNDQATLRVSNEIISATEISSVVPEPDSVSRSETETTFTFNTSEGAQLVTIHGTWQTIGAVSGTIASDTSTVPINHFIYP